MKIAISGAGGFLGRHLVSALLERPDMELIAFTSQVGALPRHAKLSVLPRDAAEDPTSFYDVDVLVGCAFARGSDPEGLAQGLDYIASTYAASRRSGVPALVNISSQSVYGVGRSRAADERTPVSLNSAYAAAKYATELLTLAMSDGVGVLNVRLGSLMGPGFDQRIVNRMVATALTGGNLYAKDPNRKFSYTDVRDAASAIRDVLGTSMWTDTSLVNVGNSRSWSMGEIADTVADVVRKQRLATPLVHYGDMSADNNVPEMNTRLFDSLTGGTAWRSLEDSVSAIVGEHCAGAYRGRHTQEGDV